MKQHTRRVSRLTAIVAANLVLLVAMLIIIEGIASYAFFLRDLASRLRDSDLSHTKYDAEIGWVGLPNVDIKDVYGLGAHLRTNAKGFRNDGDFPANRTSGKRRIVCSGDSVTFGEYVGNDQTFCSLLAEWDPELETINMGQVGYGVDQAYLWYKRDTEELDVDISILAFITHDFMRMQYDKFMGIPRPVVELKGGELIITNTPISESTYKMPTWLAETLNSADGLRTMKLATKLRDELDLAPGEVPGAWDARGAEEVEAVVGGIFEDLRNYDAARSRTTVLVYFPSVEELQQPNAELAFWMSVVESNAQRLDIPLVNFVSLFSKLPVAEATRLFVDGYHFSESGHELVARELLKHLRNDPRITPRSGAPQQTFDDGRAPAPSGMPYEHVKPSDVGKTIGVGVVAPVPTVPYTGPTNVTGDDTLIENVVITEELNVTGDNVTLRNVIIDVNSWNGITFAGANNARLEYSRINNRLDGKAIRVEDLTGIHIENNEISGGQDFFFFSLALDEVYIENNYMHHVVGGPDAHADGFMWFESFDNDDFFIRGNYMTMNNDSVGVTDAIFITDPTANVRFENNYIGIFGWHTLRCQRCSGEFTIQNNVYAQEFKAALPAPGSPTSAILYEPLEPDLPAAFRCNRYEDGSFVETRYVSKTHPIRHDTRDCPSYQRPAR